MKFFKIINLTLLFLFSCSLANAKPLPPGTGNAVPSNILFLVDRSQSMNTSSSGRVANKMRRPPVDVVGRGGGIYYLSTKNKILAGTALPVPGGNGFALAKL